jgi:uncharacterized damage-inducible protein DinB
MPQDFLSLISIFDGWDTYQESLVRSIEPLSPEQLSWRPAPHLRSAGQITAHISAGRIQWFQRMNAPGSAELAAQAAKELSSEDLIAGRAGDLVRWLEASWRLVENTLSQWTVSNLAETYRQPFQGKTYAVSHQWTIWRILAHDLHHGGELSVTLGLQGIPVPQLGDLGGHLTVPPVAE